MKLKKVIATVLTVAMTFGLAACGSGSGSSSAEADSEAKEITIWAWDENFNIRALNIAKEYYENENPDVTVNVENKAREDILQKLNTALAANNYEGLPNVVLIEDLSIGGYLHSFPDAIRVMSDIISTDDWADYKLTAMSLEGECYGVPFDSGVSALFYRSDLFEEAGYTAEDLENITWDEFIEIGKKVKEVTGTYVLHNHPGEIELIPIMLQSAGTWFVKEDGETLNIAGNEAIAEALETYKRLMESGIVYDVPGWDEEVEGLVNGTMSGICTGNWITPSIKTADDQTGKWAIAPTPRMSGSGSVNYSNYGGSAYYVLNNVDGVDTAVDFLDKTLANNTEILNECVVAIDYLSTHVDDGNFTNYENEDEFFGNDQILKKLSTWQEGVPGVSYGDNTLNIINIFAEEMPNILNGADIYEELEAIEERVSIIAN